MIDLFSLKKEDKYIEGINLKSLKRIINDSNAIKNTGSYILIKEDGHAKYKKIDCVAKYYKMLNGKKASGTCKTIQRQLGINQTSLCLNCHKNAINNFFDGKIK